MPDLPKTDVLAAVLIFRLFYLLIPFALAIGVVLLFERGRLAEAMRSKAKSPAAVPPAPVDGPGITPDLRDTKVRKAV